MSDRHEMEGIARDAAESAARDVSSHLTSDMDAMRRELDDEISSLRRLLRETRQELSELRSEVQEARERAGK